VTVNCGNCGVEGCGKAASDVIAYTRIDAGDPGLAQTTRLAFCPVHADGLREVATVLGLDHEGGTPMPILRACDVEGCPEAATQKLVDDAGAGAACFCDAHAPQMLATLTGTACLWPGCGLPGEFVALGALGSDGFYGCQAHRGLVEAEMDKARKESGA